MFSVDDYFTDEHGNRRDAIYSTELTTEILGNAQATVDRWNLLLTHFYSENPSASKRRNNSGWRPRAINTVTPGAAPNSTHLLAEAMDVSDDDQQLAVWILGNEHAAKKLAVPSYASKIGLWFEDFRTTQKLVKGVLVRWVHGQIVPPHSGNRIYIPSNDWAARLGGRVLTLEDLQTPLTVATLS